MKRKNKIALLSDTVLKWLRIGIKIPSTIGSIPYDWDEKEKRVVFNPSYKRFGVAEGTEELEFESPLSSNVKFQTTSVSRYFRQMEVLNVMMNELWSTANAILEISLLIGVILACYGVVRYDATRATHQAIIVVLLAGTVIILWGIMDRGIRLTLLDIITTNVASLLLSTKRS
ncbi:unnamed protein product [Allacma fusca]|uniref:Uncharacterized protein n=1 Tax=Allacma fusca TaxID=39272 RepID=A0A8J2KUL6_9HEXA|nr:unnamed protein product [Allacma fusca]